MLFELIVATIWFILPAYVANALPSALSRVRAIQRYNLPIDFGRKLRGRPILGPGKTWLGLFVGVAAGTLFGILQGRALLIVFLLSFGALAGDSMASFFKRRFGYNRGKSIILLDQLDFIIGAFAFATLVTSIDWQMLAVALALTPFVHLSANVIGYKLGLKSEWW